MSDKLQIATNKYAVRITGGGFQGVIEMPGAEPPSVGEGDDIKRIMADQFRADVDYIVECIQAAGTGAPLMAIDDDTQRATVIVPGPGMAYNILSWADHLAEQQRGRELQAEMQRRQQQAGRVGQPSRVGRPNGRGRG